MKRIFLTSVAILLAAAVFAQQSSSHLSKSQLKKIKKYQVLRNQQDGDLQYGHEFDVGGRLNTNGWSAYLEYEKRSGEATSTMYQFELGEIKHPKENKQARASRDAYGYPYSAHAFVYGKRNIFYQAKLGIGQRRRIGGKGNKNGVEVSAIYLGGFSAGLVKPYYLELTGDVSGTSSYQKYSEENAAVFLNPNDILAGPGLGRGWSEVQFVPGLYGRIGMRFDWAEFNEFVSALEVGLNGELYSKKVQIMVQNPGKQFFYGAYVSLIFGKRW